jgi:hypothetical protein
MIELDWDLWATDTMRTWKDDDIKKMLDLAEDCLVKACTNLRLDVQVDCLSLLLFLTLHVCMHECVHIY